MPVEFYTKTPGFEEYRRVTGSIETSRKGYKILRHITQEPITRYRYYKQDPRKRFIMLLDDCVHEIGHDKFFEILKNNT